MQHRALWTSIALAAMLAAFTLTAQADLTARTDPQAEIELGRQVAREVERQHPLSPDRASQERVRRVGHAVLDQVEPRVYPYEFKVLANPEVNAFALPGGFIYVHEGLLARIPDDNALGFVLAHEATHVAHRHIAGMIEKMKGVELVAIIASVAAARRGGATSDVTNQVAALAMALVQASYSREDENDADATAMEYLWQAGYDLDGGPAAMRMIQEIERGHSVPRYLRSHPPAADRLARVQALAKKLARRRRAQDASAVGAAPPSDLRPSPLVGDLSSVAVAANPWFPLAVGNEWTYEVKGARGKSAYVLRIIGAIPAGEHTVYAAETVLGTQTSVPCQLVTTAGQVWRRSRLSADDAWRLEMDTDVASDSPQARDDWEYRLLGIEDISVPCGSFSAARKIQKQGGNPVATLHLWFVEGIGLVKRQTVESGVTETLVRYHVAPPIPPAPTPANPEKPPTTP